MSKDRRQFPEHISNEEELEKELTAPRPELLKFIGSVQSPLVILGAGGKMGPTLAVLAKRASEEAGVALEVIAVSRFTDPASRAWLKSRGVKTIAADLLERRDVRRLPDAANLIYLVGLKFGTAQNPSLTWAANAITPALVAERYAGSRMVALSTGNVYPFAPVAAKGVREDHPLTPLGEYPNAAVARERIFEHCSRRDGTKIALIRLNYAVELRYGVLVDIARKVLAGDPIDLANGHFNCIWQRDANEMILRALPLAASPPSVWNLSGPEVISVRETARSLGKLLGKAPKFAGREKPTALLSNSARVHKALGLPPTPLEAALRWTAHWVKSGGGNLGKPTHFEVRDGAY